MGFQLDVYTFMRDRLYSFFVFQLEYYDLSILDIFSSDCGSHIWNCFYNFVWIYISKLHLFLNCGLFWQVILFFLALVNIISFSFLSICDLFFLLLLLFVSFQWTFYFFFRRRWGDCGWEFIPRPGWLRPRGWRWRGLCSRSGWWHIWLETLNKYHFIIISFFLSLTRGFPSWICFSHGYWLMNAFFVFVFVFFLFFGHILSLGRCHVLSCLFLSLIS